MPTLLFLFLKVANIAVLVGRAHPTGLCYKILAEVAAVALAPWMHALKKEGLQNNEKTNDVELYQQEYDFKSFLDLADCI